MTLDLIVAGEGAKFGQPEINIGVIPGRRRHPAPDARHRQGKAMRMILTGDPITAAEAERAGLVAAVTQDELVVEDALALAAKIATKSPDRAAPGEGGGQRRLRDEPDRCARP